MARIPSHFISIAHRPGVSGGRPAVASIGAGTDTPDSVSLANTNRVVLFARLGRVQFEEGSLIHLVAGGVSVFRIIELGVDGDPTTALVQAVDDSPGTYPWPTDLAHAVPAEQP